MSLLRSPQSFRLFSTLKHIRESKLSTAANVSITRAQPSWRLMQPRYLHNTPSRRLPEPISTSSTSATTSSPQPSITRPKLTYHVTRTHSNNLPVYVDIRSGGTRIETIIRKVHGDSQTLLKDISDALGLGEVKAFVRRPNGHVVFAGRHKERVCEFLLKQGF